MIAESDEYLMIRLPISKTEKESIKKYVKERNFLMGIYVKKLIFKDMKKHSGFEYDLTKLNPEMKKSKK